MKLLTFLATLDLRTWIERDIGEVDPINPLLLNK